MKRIATFIAFATLGINSALATEPRYAGFDVTDPVDPKVTFSFCAVDATSTSPLVLTIPGRKLTNDDRKHRVDLQKYWVSQHKPEGSLLVSRTLNECGLV